MKVFGVIALVVGFLGLLGSLAMDTTVASGGLSERVHNIGLLNDKQNIILIFAAVSVIGAIFVALGRSSRIPVPSSTTLPDNSVSPERKCPFCAESIKVEALLCRFCGRESQQFAPVGTATTDTNLAFHLEPGNAATMHEHGITYEGNRYHVEGSEFTRLSTAITHAIRLRAEKA